MAVEKKEKSTSKLKFFSDFRYSLKAINLVWLTSKKLTIILGLLTILAGLLPASIAYIGKLIVDSVLIATKSGLPPGLSYSIINLHILLISLDTSLIA